MNGTDITIEDVRLQMEKSNSIEGKVEVVITLRNNSKNLTYYMLRRPRHIDYDGGSRALIIGLYEKEGSADIGYAPFEPEQITILPDSVFQWRYWLPVWMKRVTRAAGLREVVEVLDISGVRKVECTIAYDTRPFRVETFSGAMGLSKWGKRVAASFERSVVIT